MTIKQELKKYAEQCISNKIVSCKKHKQACQRFLNDLDKSEKGNENFPYIWVEDKAQQIVNWFALLKHSKGTLAGQFIHLTTSQKFFICQIYGWRHKDTGYKRFSKAFKEVGRKNAKSQEQAGFILFEMAVGSTSSKEIYECYCAGTKRQQSEIIFNECQNMLKGSPLAIKFKCGRKIIVHIKTGSFLTALCKDDGKNGDGTNPAILVLDEYHQHKTTEFYDLGLGANTKESLLIIITTAGMDLNCPCYLQEYDYCSDIINPETECANDNYLVDIYEADKGDKPDDINTWKKANPVRMSYEDGINKIKEAWEIAKNIPDKMTAFLTKILDVWVQAKENGYMDMAKWNACKVKELPIDIKGRDVYVGFDMSAKIDLTSVSFIIPFLDGETVKYILFSHSFIPNYDKLRERIAVDKMPYDAWERNGWLTITNTEIVDQNAVMKYVVDFCDKYNLKINALCFDPANASKIMMDMSDEGYDVVEVYQSHKSLNESTAGFREQVYCGNVIFVNNPLLNYAMGNAVVRSNNGLIKIDKDATRKRIDPVDATLCAFKLAFYHEFTTSYADSWLDD